MRLTLEEQPLETDKVFTFGDVKVVINERDKSYFDNMQLDFKKDTFGFGGFTLVNQ